MSEKPFTGTVSQMKQSSKFLAAEDFIGLGEKEATISEIYANENEVMQDGKKKDFHSLGFAKTDKRLVLNATNRKCLVACFGGDPQNWKGKKIKLFAQDGIRNPAGGATVWGVRIKATPDPELIKARRDEMTGGQQ